MPPASRSVPSLASSNSVPSSTTPTVSSTVGIGRCLLRLAVARAQLSARPSGLEFPRAPAACAL